MMNIFAVYWIFITFVVRVVHGNENNMTTERINYCDHPDCSLENQHTLCLAVNKQSARLYASGMTTWMRYQILLLHNRHRDNIAMGIEAGQPPATNMRKFYWDYELEHAAEVWARQCQTRHDECRNTVRFNVLQNMDVRPVVARVTEAQLLADAVGSWFSGSRVLPPERVLSFKLSNCSAPSGCNAHWYSAAAWASTWRLGCSQALCTAKKHKCTVFRKKRTTPEMTEVFKETESTTENILIRQALDPKTKSSAGIVENSDQKYGKESPLHRGILDMVTKPEDRNDVRIIAYTFCNYGPAGNIDGFPIYEPGTSCSNCPMGTQCGDRTHRALCTVIGDPDVL